MSNDDKRDEIDDKCRDSWDFIKDFYYRLIYENEFDTWGFLKPVIPLINEMQDCGYDKWLCLGQSHHWLTVSFPRASSPKILVIEFYSLQDKFPKRDMDIVMRAIYADGETSVIHESNQISFNDDLKAILDRMVSKLQD